MGPFLKMGGGGAVGSRLLVINKGYPPFLNTETAQPYQLRGKNVLDASKFAKNQSPRLKYLVCRK